MTTGNSQALALVLEVKRLVQAFHGGQQPVEHSDPARHVLVQQCLGGRQLQRHLVEVGVRARVGVGVRVRIRVRVS